MVTKITKDLYGHPCEVTDIGGGDLVFTFRRGRDGIAFWKNEYTEGGPEGYFEMMRVKYPPKGKLFPGGYTEEIVPGSKKGWIAEADIPAIVEEFYR